MMDTQKQKHWRIETDDDNICWLAIDKADTSTNVLSSEVLSELSDIIGAVADEKPKGLVIHSAKESGFIAGADVHEFEPIKTEEEAMALIRKGQGIFDMVESLGFPVVAMIHGFCLGGGTELALAAHYRVASTDKKTKIGLPEILLGIHPGFGGAVRSTRLVGPIDAMNMMLTGRALSAKAAKKIGLVDYAVPRRHLATAARNLINKKPRKGKPKFFKGLANNRLVRGQLAKVFTKKVAKRAPKIHYPAPYALIDVWLNHFGDKQKMLEAEARSVSRLITGQTAQNLIRLFFLQERMKQTGSGETFNVENVHVIGAGVMGGDIASWLALRGYRVTLQDTAPERIAPAIKRAHALFKKKLKEPRLIQAAMDRLMPDTAAVGAAQADVIIEAIFENVEAKQSLYAAIEPVMKQTAILATNTSSIPLEILSEKLDRPERLVGLHFFNPVSKMLLVEVVRGEKTSEKTVLQAASFVKKMDRLPLVVKSSPGFLVNRILMPYLLEAITMAEEGISIVDIDKAATSFGMPMGPVTLADTVGLDICLSVSDILSESMDVKTPDILRKMVDGGKLGVKSGSGFYKYKKGKAVKPSKPKDYKTPDGVSDRLVYRLLNEAVACVREGVVEDADMCDAGVVFGTGFAPFRGGPMKYTESIGYADARKKLAELAKSFGDRFSEDEGWAALDKG